MFQFQIFQRNVLLNKQWKKKKKKNRKYILAIAKTRDNEFCNTSQQKSSNILKIATPPFIFVEPSVFLQIYLVAINNRANE